MCKGVLFWSRESREKGWLGLEEPSKEKEKHIGTERSRKRKRGRERGGEKGKRWTFGGEWSLKRGTRLVRCAMATCRG